MRRPVAHIPELAEALRNLLLLVTVVIPDPPRVHVAVGRRLALAFVALDLDLSDAVPLDGGVGYFVLLLGLILALDCVGVPLFEILPGNFTVALGHGGA